MMKGRQAQRALRDLCFSQGVEFEPRQVESLLRYVTSARAVWTTGPVVAEVFHHLERAAGQDFPSLLVNIRARLPAPTLFCQEWSACLASPEADKFGATDASVLHAVRRIPQARLVIQDHRLHGWCRRKGLPVVTCFELAHTLSW